VGILRHCELAEKYFFRIALRWGAATGVNPIKLKSKMAIKFTFHKKEPGCVAMGQLF